MSKYETINQESIAKLMEIFYEKIRIDENLGPIFNKAVGVSNEEWKKHKKKIGNFWTGMLLGEGDYNGQPLKKHMDLPPFKIELFDNWLSLFEESLKSIYNDEMSNVILQRANMIAKNFKKALYPNI
ncbi:MULTISPECIES: group III truncated hemoglobin [unclassified Campylobacter]|uniref:group III truncated hemoglobin n=1 Tax=unclassified Campylobacter TaxID=2593542 RepID=UPI001237D57B|nr:MULTISPECIES: group III truncated hemoglobin [unclassified Campylobacter]KAA6224795.1 group III truncated hemoglobin [Campylobacter sp. LR185c]KAA6227370.1 group III truncated hemoglobin [Campylobacter sp. LR196d]KAA6228747.1 group III truncated hemoglobin [Campylobacter sp. LR286c]KAA6229557.1 group III truncated hemoglobin [Campylobacter sp. LR264d]KAA6230801.1 group III truncated hemoglobin [Campylobacter sp. LR291e]